MTTTKKRTMLIPILITLAFIIIAILLVAATRPADFRVSRSTTIAAPASAAFPYINETKKWEIWNPWGKLDPNMKLAYDGPTAGAGASYSWEGNNQVGVGKLVGKIDSLDIGFLNFRNHLRDANGDKRQDGHINQKLDKRHTRQVRPLPPRFLQAHGWHK